MAIRFERWDLSTDRRPMAVLRVTRDGVYLSDPGFADCFESALAAAEAAWRMAGAPQNGDSWLDRAQEAMTDDVVGTLGGGDNPRIVTSRDMGSGEVVWLDIDEQLTAGTGEWALVSQAIEAAGAPTTASRRAAILTPTMPQDPDPDPLSGTQTSEWAFASLAGRGVPKVEDP